jgi:trk system potassium uptake protein TrkA
MNLHSLKVPHIICKAHDATHREIPQRLGADRVIIPEWEMADKLALGLTSAGIMEYIELSEEYGIVEMEPPEAWLGKSIRELDLRSRYGINVLALRHGESISIPPDISLPIDSGCTLTLLSSYSTLNKLQKKDAP